MMLPVFILSIKHIELLSIRCAAHAASDYANCLTVGRSLGLDDLETLVNQEHNDKAENERGARISVYCLGVHISESLDRLVENRHAFG